MPDNPQDETARDSVCKEAYDLIVIAAAFNVADDPDPETISQRNSIAGQELFAWAVEHHPTLTLAEYQNAVVGAVEAWDRYVATDGKPEESAN